MGGSAVASINTRKETGKLVIDFRFKGQRCREQTALDDSSSNRKRLKRLVDRIDEELAAGTFDYARYFPNSKNAEKFSATADAPPPAFAPTAVPPPTSTFAAHPSPTVAPAPSVRPTFGDFSDTWMQEHEVSWRRSYRRTVADIVGKHLASRFAERDVGGIAREELLKLRSELAKVPGRKKEMLSPRRINAIMNVMSLILKEASDRYQFTCPFYNIKPLKIPKSDVQPFTLAEVKQILAAVRPDYRDYYTVRFFTGMRTGEVDGLAWEFVDFERRLILVRQTLVAGELEDDAKTVESIRDIQMSQVVFDALQRQRANTGRKDGFVFCTQGGRPLDHNNVTKRVWYPLLRLLGLKLRRPYQTRHTAATLWLASGENPEWIARQMGHTSTEMLFKVYSRYVPNLTRRDGSAFERLITGALADSALSVADEDEEELGNV